MFSSSKSQTKIWIQLITISRQIMTSTKISKVIFGIFVVNILLHETVAEEKERDEKLCI